MRLVSRSGMDVHEAHELLARGDAVAFDVRGSAEWRAGRISGGENRRRGMRARQAGGLPLEPRDGHVA